MGSKVEVTKIESLNCRNINSNSPQKEEEDDDDGPPPGFNSLLINSSTDIKNVKNIKHEKVVSEDDDDDDGPPPGFQSISPKNTLNIKKHEKNESFVEIIGDHDGPPPGFQSISLKNTLEIKKHGKDESFIENIDDDDDDGPPPGFYPAHVIKQADDVSVSDSHSILGLNPNSQFELKISGDASKLEFESIHVRDSGNGLNPIYQSDVKVLDECEVGLRSDSVIEDGKSGDGLESGLKSFNLMECELGLRSYSEKGEEKIIDGSELGLKTVSVEESEHGLQSISEKGKENGGEKIGDGSELGFKSVPNKDRVEDADESEVGSQPLPMIEDEKEDNVCRTGLQSISEIVGREEKNDDNDDDDGPPPGWGSFLPPRPPNESLAPPHQPPSSVSPQTGSGSAHVREEERAGDELEVGSQLDPMIEDGKEDDDSELESQSFPVETEEKGSTPVKEEEDDNEGLPPRWFSCHPSKGLNKALAPPKLSPFTPAQFDPMKEDENERDGSKLESLSFPVKTEGKGSTSVKEVEDDEGPPPGWYSCHPSKGPMKALSPFTPAPPNPLPSATSSEEKGPTPVIEEEDHEGPPPGWYSCHPSKVRSKALSPPQLPLLTPAPPNPHPSVTSSGKAQMVCGSCRTLLSYPKGSRFVQCSCCETVNLVLEEHQVGQVKCRGCTLLLMYPYGAPSVQCSSCLFVTKVGVQNKRPPLSMQQGRPQLLANPVT